MLQKHKQPSLAAGLMIILAVVSMFSFAFMAKNKATGNAAAIAIGCMFKAAKGVVNNA